MSEKFIAVSMVTGPRKRGCSSKPRRDFSIMRGWQQMINAINGLSNFQFSEKNLC